MSNGGLFYTLLAGIIIIVSVSIIAHNDRDERNTAKCKQMLKKYSYQSRYTGEYEVIHGDLFCYDSNNHLHQYKGEEK